MSLAALPASRAVSWLLRLLLPAVLVATALGVQFTDPQFRARLRDNAFDQLQSLWPLPYRDELPVRVIAIDDASLAALGQWPWPRTLLAGIVDRLTAMGARVVVFDVVLAEPDRSSPEQVAALWPGQRALRELLSRLPAHDRRLAQSIARSRVAIGFPLDTGAASTALPPAKAHFLSFGGDGRDWLPNYRGGIASLPLLTDAAAGSGAISLAPDSDGVLRAMPLVYRVGDALYPGLALEALRLFRGADNVALRTVAADAVGAGHVPGIQAVGLGDAGWLRTAADGRVWLRYRHLASARYLSAQDLLAGRVEARQVRDHIVFVGATAKGLGDNVVSPLGEPIPGVEGHVQLTEQLLAAQTLLRPSWENDLVAALLLGMWLALGMLLARARPAWSVLLAMAVVAGLFALSAWLFLARGLLLDPFYPALAIAALFGVMAVPRYLQTEWEQRWIRNAFARYVSPNRVRYLQAHPQDLELGAVHRECSFVMSDIAGFTALMERRAPAEVSGLLNDYLDGMIGIAFRHDGTLDRVVGDAVAVLFSAPLVQADHAARALACALEMDAFAVAFSRRQRAQGIALGRTRIGVHSGTVLVGNFGGRALLDYRALGDAINVAARLESVNARLGTRVCVSGATAAGCPDFSGRPIGELVLKGKTEAVMAFEPLAAQAESQAPLADYLAAYALLEAQDATAPAAFAELAQRYPDDALVAFHAQRLAAGATGSRVVMGGK